MRSRPGWIVEAARAQLFARACRGSREGFRSSGRLHYLIRRLTRVSRRGARRGRGYPRSCSSRASCSATYTERCLPPVQPIADRQVALALVFDSAAAGSRGTAPGARETRGVSGSVSRYAATAGSMPVLPLELRHEVRVRQEPHVEEQVDAVRHAVLVAEGRRRDDHPGAAPGRPSKRLLEERAQLVDGHR